MQTDICVCKNVKRLGKAKTTVSVPLILFCSGSSASAESCGSPGSLGQGASHALRSQEGVGDLGLNDGPAVLAKQGSLGLLGNVLRNPAELQLQR